jgi:hypothetical protein
LPVGPPQVVRSTRTCMRARAERSSAGRHGTPPRPAARRPVGMRCGTAGGVGGTSVGRLRCAWPLGSTRVSERSGRSGGAAGLGPTVCRSPPARPRAQSRHQSQGRSNRCAQMGTARQPETPPRRSALPHESRWTGPSPTLPAPRGVRPRTGVPAARPVGQGRGRRHRPACRGRSGDTGPIE